MTECRSHAAWDLKEDRPDDETWGLVGHRLKYCDGVKAKPRCRQVGAHHMRVAKMTIDRVQEGKQAQVPIFKRRKQVLYTNM